MPTDTPGGTPVPFTCFLCIEDLRLNPEEDYGPTVATQGVQGNASFHKDTDE